MDIIERIDKFHEERAEPPRPHLGCSQLGHPCDRWLWLSFRWAVIPQHSGRVLRMFRRGKLEEEQVISDLRSIGIDVRYVGKGQVSVALAPHVEGSVDGIIYSGVPGAEREKHVLEIKTCSAKSFSDLEKSGVRVAKPEHWVQVQLYMHGTKINRALYIAICKNDDSMYSEIIEYNADEAEKYIERGRRITLSDRMPEPISTSPSWYQCKTCHAYEFCHKERLTKQVNCRTCAHSTPKEDGTWRCERYDADNIPLEFQRHGCDGHVLHPDLVPWPMKDSSDGWTAIYIIDGREVANGEPDANVYASTEIIANPHMCGAEDNFIDKLREEFDAKISG